MGDRLWTGKPPRRRTKHPGLLSLSPPSVAGWNEYPAKAGGVNRHIAWYTSPYPWLCSVMLMPGWTGWLAETSADLREAVAHQRRVRDDALYKSAVTLLHFARISGTIQIRTQIRWNANRKSYMISQMISMTMTLSDLIRSFQLRYWKTFSESLSREIQLSHNVLTTTRWSLANPLAVLVCCLPYLTVNWLISICIRFLQQL